MSQYLKKYQRKAIPAHSDKAIYNGGFRDSVLGQQMDKYQERFDWTFSIKKAKQLWLNELVKYLKQNETKKLFNHWDETVGEKIAEMKKLCKKRFGIKESEWGEVDPEILSKKYRN